MSTVLNTNGSELRIPEPADKDACMAIVTADWNSDITYELERGAREVLLKAGVERVDVFRVPGTVELVNAAARIRQSLKPAAVIVIGCVIRGDTPHFDYVCRIAAEGAAILNADGGAPVIFGVLTVDNMQQALDRAGGRLGNKGSEAACAAIAMANLHSELK